MSQTEPSDPEPLPSNPFERYRILRKERPVSREANGPWRVARYAEVRQVLRDNATFSSDVARGVVQDAGRAPTMLFSDPPEHTRLRKLLGNTFAPRSIGDQRAAIERRCEELVSQMCTRTQPDLVYELASPLPVTVIANMLGVGDGDFREFKRWSDTIFGNIGDILFRAPSDEVAAAAAEMNGYFSERIARLRKEEQPHLLGRLATLETEDGRLSDEELLSFCRLLLIAGNETTTSLIVGSVRVFHDFPETFSRLKAERELIPGFIEEVLRFYSPFLLTVRRVTKPVELCGQMLSEGDIVLPLIASANRDEDVFERSEEFIIDRKPNPHLAFGSGIHTCLGSALARLEGQIAVASLLDHLDEISMAEYDLEALSRLGGPRKLPVNIRVAA